MTKPEATLSELLRVQVSSRVTVSDQLCRESVSLILASQSKLARHAASQTMHVDCFDRIDFFNQDDAV